MTREVHELHTKAGSEYMKAAMFYPFDDEYHACTCNLPITFSPVRTPPSPISTLAPVPLPPKLPFRELVP